jgi:hypothetical protein
MIPADSPAQRACQLHIAAVQLALVRAVGAVLVTDRISRPAAPAADARKKMISSPAKLGKRSYARPRVSFRTERSSVR